MLMTAYLKPLSAVAALSIAAAMVVAEEQSDQLASTPASNVPALTLQSEPLADEPAAATVTIAQAQATSEAPKRKELFAPTVVTKSGQTATIAVENAGEKLELEVTPTLRGDAVEVATSVSMTESQKQPQPSANAPPTNSPSAAAPQQELIDFYQQLVERLQILHDQGQRGGSTAQLASAKQALQSARARLALEQGDRQQAIVRYREAAQQADAAFEARRAEYDRGMITLDVLIETAEQRAGVKQRLAQLLADKSPAPHTIHYGPATQATPSPPPTPAAATYGAAEAEGESRDAKRFKEQLELEKNYWQLKAEALEAKAKSEVAGVKQAFAVEGAISEFERQKLLADAKLMSAESMLARSKAIELERKIVGEALLQELQKQGGVTFQATRQQPPVSNPYGSAPTPIPAQPPYVAPAIPEPAGNYNWPSYQPIFNNQRSDSQQASNATSPRPWSQAPNTHAAGAPVPAGNDNYSSGRSQSARPIAPPLLANPTDVTSPPEVDDGQRLQPGDAIALSFHDNSDALKRGSSHLLVVKNDGQIEVPGLGKVDLGGKSRQEAILQLKLQLRSHMPEPQVTIRKLGTQSEVESKYGFTWGQQAAPKQKTNVPPQQQISPLGAPLVMASPAPEDQLDAMRRRLEEQGKVIEELQKQLTQANPQTLVLGRPIDPPATNKTYRLGYDATQAPEKSSGDIQPGEMLSIQVLSFPDGEEFVSSTRKPVRVETRGTVALGAEWGRVQIGGLSLEEAERVIQKAVTSTLQTMRDEHSRAYEKADGKSRLSFRYDRVRSVRVQVTRLE